MPKPTGKEAVFENQIKMPYNECESCGQTYVILNVREYDEEFTLQHKIRAWAYQECTICPYCGYDSSKQTITETGK